MRKGTLDVKRCQFVAIAALSVLALSATAQQPQERTQPPPNQTRPSTSQDQNRSTYETSHATRVPRIIALLRKQRKAGWRK